MRSSENMALTHVSVPSSPVNDMPTWAAGPFPATIILARNDMNHGNSSSRSFALVEVTRKVWRLLLPTV